MTRCNLIPFGAASLLALSGGAQAQTGPVPAAPVTRPAPVTLAEAAPSSPEVAQPAGHRPARLRKASPAGRGVARANRAAKRAVVRAQVVDPVQVYRFTEGSLYPVHAAPERVTDIQLEPGEALISVAAGDTARWVIGDTTSGSGAQRRTHVLVKPFAAGLSTNAVITTDRRSYHLALSATSGTAMVALSWTYAQDALLAWKRAESERRAAVPVATGIMPDQLRFDYAISGDRPDWRPLRAFDDGRQTWIEFPEDVAVGEAPPLFLVGRSGEAELVNYRLQGRYYVVDRIFDAAELRLGLRKQQVVRITRLGGARRSRR